MLQSRRFDSSQTDAEALRPERQLRHPRPTRARALIALLALAAAAWILATLLGHSLVPHHRHVGHTAHHVEQAQSAAVHTNQKQSAAASKAGAAACHTEEHAEYEGDLVRWGSDNLQDSAEACCESCKQAPGCNVWVWCPRPGGCAPRRGHQECWLKQQRGLNPLLVKGTRHPKNFRALCTGEKGTVPQGHEGAGQQYHFKGRPFYRIIDRFIDQTGADTESVFGGYFEDDPGGLQLKHDRKGLLSMANSGRDQNSSHFSILMGPAPHLDGHYTIFGEVVEGFHVAEAVNALARGQPDNFMGPGGGAVITDSGQLRCGSLCGGLPSGAASLRAAAAYL